MMPEIDGTVAREYAVAETDAATYLVEIVASGGDPAVLRQGLLEPAVDAFAQE